MGVKGWVKVKNMGLKMKCTLCNCFFFIVLVSLRKNFLNEVRAANYILHNRKN